MAYPRHLAHFAVGVPAELQVVGVNKILQSRPVTLEPRVRLCPIQTRANVLVLDVAYWQTASADDEIRYAAGNVRRFVYGTLGNTPPPQSFDERVSCSAPAMVGCLSRRLRLCDSLAIGSKDPCGRAVRWDHA